MINEVKQFFGLAKCFESAGYFEGEGNRRTLSELETGIKLGGLIVLSGELGSGKTVLVREFRKKLIEESEFLVSNSLSLNKERLSLKMIFLDLFSELDARKAYEISASPKLTEERFIELIKSKNKPAALFIDDAQDCAPELFADLERLTENVWKGNVLLSVVLVGQPELEKISGRVKIIRFEGIQGEEKNYLRWILSDCSEEGTEPEDIFSEEAMELIARHCHTPLRINRCAWLALEDACRIERKPAGEGIVKEVMAKLSGKVI